MAWLARGDFTGSDYVQASDLNNLHNDDVTWGGNVNGGGYTLSNVILEGVVTQSGASGVSSFNTRIGAVVSQSGDYTAAMVGAVPTSLQILTPPGSGLSGGGPLTGNLSLSAAMVSFNARVGVITLTPADISGAMGVLQSRAITAGAGLQGGGNLAQDVPLSVIPGDPTQQIQFIQGGLAVATRHAINFISGANVNVAVADPGSASGRVDVTISSTGGGSGMVDPTTTKGDVIVRGPSITGRLPVGADGQVLTADSTQSLGVKWGAASGSGAVASVFGRTGAVVAATGDYSAAQVTNAVDRSQTYSDPMWLTGLNWSKIIAAPTFLLDPTTTKGDLVVHGASAISRLPVGGDGAILVADSTQALGVRWGASLPSSIPAGQFAGDMLIWQQAGGWGLISAAGQPAAVGNVLTVQSIGASTKLAWQAPPPSQATLYWVNGTQVQSSFGVNFVAGNNTTIAGAMDGSGTKVNITITAGGPTSGLADPTTTKGDLIARATAQVTRLPVGTDGTILMADSTQALGVKWATVSGGGGGGAQTPWTSNIDAAGFTLNNIPVIQAPASNNNLILNAPGAGGSISLQADGTTMATINETAGLIAWGSIIANVNVVNGGPPSVTLAGFGEAQWSLTGTSSPTTPGTDLLTFQCFEQTAGIYVMNDLGYFGIGVAAPAHAVDAAGDCNVTGLYRIGGAQLAAAQVVNAVSTLGSYADPAWITSLAWSKITGAPGAAFYQTPWVTDINGANHNLSNVKSIGVGTSTPYSALHVKTGAAGPAAALNADTIVFAESAGNSYYEACAAAGKQAGIVFGRDGKTNTSNIVDTPGATPLFQLAANTAGSAMAFYTAGLERVRIDASGNVGIGLTPTGASALEVMTTSAIGLRLRNTNGASNNNVQLRFYGAVAAADLWAIGPDLSAGNGGKDLSIYNMAGGITAFFQASNNQVGLGGMTAPIYGCHVQGNLGVLQAAAVNCTVGVDPGSAAANATIGGFYYDTANNVLRMECVTSGVAWRSISLTPRGGTVGVNIVVPSSSAKFQVSTGANESFVVCNPTAVPGAVCLGAVDDAFTVNIPLEIRSSATTFSYGNVGVGIAPISAFPLVVHAAANVNLGVASVGGLSLQAVNDAQNAYTSMTMYATSLTIANPVAIGVGPRPGAMLFVAPPANPAGVGNAQLVIGEPSNNTSYGLNLGFYYDSGATNTWRGTIQANQGSGYHLLLNALGGNVGVGQGIYQTTGPRSALSVIAPNQTTTATAVQITVCEGSNSAGYHLGLGYLYDTANGNVWKGVVQALANGSPAPLILNPTGGGVGIAQLVPNANCFHVNACVCIGTGAPASSPGDLVIARNGAPTTGVVYFGNTGTHYLYWDGTNFNLTGPLSSVTVNGNVNITGQFQVNGVPLTSGMAALGFHNSGGNLGSGTIIDIYGGGGTTVSGGMNGTIGAYSITSASDARLKQNVTTLVGGLSVVTQLRPIRAEWNGLLGKRLGEPILSVIAQEAQAVAPDAVYSFRARLNRHDENETELLAVEPLALIAHLILAVQQLEKRLKALEPAVN